jgi:tetratricopeptide (TPR) repeat protein
MRVVLTVAIVFAAGSAWCQDTADGHLGRGYDALRQERYEAAATEFRAALQIDPKLTARARFPLAVALFESKQTGEARREFEAVRRETGNHPNVLYYLGRLDLLDGNFAAAAREFQSAAAKPPFPDTAYYLGFAYFKEGLFADAEKWLKAALDLNPRDSVALYQLAMVYRKEGREEDAKKAVEQSSELRQRSAEDSQLRMECAKKLDTGSRDEAHAVCQRLWDDHNADRLTSLGTLYGQHGDLEAALAPLRRAAELEPQAPQTQYNLAFTYYRLGRFADARGPLAAAVERWPDLFPLNSLYGAVLARLGEHAGAFQALQRAHELNADDPPTNQMLYLEAMALGRRSAEKREYTEARRYFDEAVKVKPGDRDATQELSSLPPK